MRTFPRNNSCFCERLGAVSRPCLTVARGLLLHGRSERGARLGRKELLDGLGVDASTFRSSGELIGSIRARPGSRFFDSSIAGRLAFGPGAGVVVGVSVGTESLRAALVDANGWCHHAHESEPQRGQLEAEPEVVIDRIGHAIGAVLDRALHDDALLVDGALPVLGWAVAWPTPIARNGLPVGNALVHPRWHHGQPLSQRVAKRAGVSGVHSYSLNDARAAAVAVARHQTRSSGYLDWRHPRLALVLRVAGGTGAAAIIVEPPRNAGHGQWESGFSRSILIGGIDNHAGEIGHTPTDMALVERLNRDRPAGLLPLVPGRCSCALPGRDHPAHLEAFVSSGALAARLDEAAPTHEVLSRIVDDPSDELHARALDDLGVLLGSALVNPAAMLNPATITLTGALALPPLRRGIERTLAEAHTFGTHPEVVALEGFENRFIRAEGAGLTLLRVVVYRRLAALLDHDGFTTAQNIQRLTVKLDENPVRQS